MRRPDPPELSEGRAGYEWVVVPDLDWVLVNGAGYRCRHSTRRPCPNVPVAGLRRGRYSRQLWRYCDRHLYGRWIENGKVVGWRLRPIERPIGRPEGV